MLQDMRELDVPHQKTPFPCNKMKAISASAAWSIGGVPVAGVEAGWALSSLPIQATL